jgi:hypothetical protein
MALARKPRSTIALFSVRPRAHDAPMSPSPPRLSAMRRLTCARCGAAFTCGANTGACWCAAEDFRLPMPAADSTEDCLCPACLRAEAARQAAADQAASTARR